MYACVWVCMSLTAFVNFLTILTVGLLLLLSILGSYSIGFDNLRMNKFEYMNVTVLWSILCDRYAVNHFLLPHNINLNQLVTTKYRADSTFIYRFFVWMISIQDQICIMLRITHISAVHLYNSLWIAIYRYVSHKVNSDATFESPDQMNQLERYYCHLLNWFMT